MIERNLFTLILLTLLASCIDGDKDADSNECARDADCAKFSSACNTSVCRNDACTPQPVVCNDDNACTTDRCDIAGGCVFTPTGPGTPCAIGKSGQCDGMTWYPADTCDADGTCVDAASMNCEVGTGNACMRATCGAPSGCAITNELNGTDCVAGGRSDTCVDGELYFADFCDSGTCAEAGQERCPDSFCQRGRCDGDECGTIEVGLGIDLTGDWNAIGLIEDGTLVTTRIGVTLTNSGQVDIRGEVGSLDSEAPTAGEYCVATDRTLQIGFDYEGRQRTFSGRVSPGRDIAFLSADDGVGVLVMVRDRDISEARLAGGAYRVLGFDSVVRSGQPTFDTLDGTIELKNHCIASGSYRLGNAGVEVPLTITDPPACLKFDGLNLVSVDVRAPSDVHVLAGVVGTGGHYLVMQRYRVGERVLEPSLLVLVRTSLSTDEAFVGNYELLRVDAGPQITTKRGALELDGGAIVGLDDGVQRLPAGSTGTMKVESDGAFTASIPVGDTLFERRGQLGQTTFDRVDWFVDVATNAGVVSGRSLRFGVRAD